MRNLTPLLAASASLLLGAAANAQTSEVRLYGVIDAFLESAHTGKETLNRLGSGGIFTSRWGVTGSEDLGGGLKAFFRLESGFNVDTGTLGGGGRAWSRESTVGLESATWGRIEAGRMPTQINEAVSNFFMGRYGAGAFTYNPATTMTHDNGIKYTSPSFGGFNVSAHYDLGEVADSSANKAWSLQGQYRAGPVNALLGYFKSNAPRDIATANDTVKILTAAASYNFGGFQPLVMFQSAKSSLAPVSLDRYNVNLGLDIFLAADLIRFEVEFLRDRAVADANARALSVRYDHRLSKRTTIYAGAAKVFDGANAYYPIVGAGGQLPVAVPISASYNGTNPSSVILGIAHAF